MNKFAITVLALAALSTTAFASDKRDSRGYQDTLGMFTVLNNNSSGVANSNIAGLNYRGISTKKEMARLFEKNNDMGSSY
jgi:hypothetical protein